MTDTTPHISPPTATPDAEQRITELELQLEQLKQDRDDIARMGAVLAAITDLEEILSVLMQMALRTIGAEVGLIVVKGDRGYIPKVVWGFNPQAVDVLTYRDGKNIVDWVMDHGEGVVTDYFDHAAGLQFNGQNLMVGGVIALPIEVQSHLEGCVVAVNKTTGERFTDEDCSKLQILVSFAGVAIEHTRLLAESLEKQRIEQELSLAEEVQKTLVPTVDISLPGVTIQSLYLPARKVGGDYFDIIPRNAGEFFVVVGDVSDKGVPAALLMTAVRSIVRAEVQRSTSTAGIISHINDLISADLTGQKDMFVTFFCGFFDLPNTSLTYTSAGHPPSLLYSPTKKTVEELSAGGVFLGQFPGFEFIEGRQQLHPGDRLVVFTDGIIEAASPDGSLFGRDRLRHFTQENAGDRPAVFLSRLNDELKRDYGHQDFIDDRTVVVVEFDPEERGDG